MQRRAMPGRAKPTQGSMRWRLDATRGGQLQKDKRQRLKNRGERECGARFFATAAIAWGGPLEEWGAGAGCSLRTLFSRQFLGEQFVCGAEHIVWRDGEQAGIGRRTAGVIA